MGQRRRSRGRCRGVWLAILWAALIFATSSTVVRPQEFFAWIHEHLLPGEQLFTAFQLFWGSAWFVVVKGWHVGEYALLMLLVTAAIHRLTGRPTARNVVLAAAFCLAFAASDEWHQTLVPDRGGTLGDVAIDALGVLVVAAFLLRRLPCLEKEQAEGRTGEPEQ